MRILNHLHTSNNEGRYGTSHTYISEASFPGVDILLSLRNVIQTVYHQMCTDEV